MSLTRQEVGRKLLHLAALLMPVGIFYVPRFSVPSFVPPLIMALLFLIAVAVEWIRFRVAPVQRTFARYFRSMLRDKESSQVTGSTYVIAAAFGCSLLFRNHLHIAFIALFLFILGDAAAALVGQAVGRTRIGDKSLEGSAACLAVCLLLFYFVFPLFPHLLDAWGGGVPALIAVTASTATTLFELVPLKVASRLTINDNLAVPIITGMVIFGMERLVL